MPSAWHGRNRVARDVPFREFGSKVAEYRRDSSLASRAQGMVMDRQSNTDRRTLHDVAAVAHRDDRRLGDEQLADDVGLKEAIELGLGEGL